MEFNKNIKYRILQSVMAVLFNNSDAVYGVSEESFILKVRVDRYLTSALVLCTSYDDIVAVIPEFLLSYLKINHEYSKDKVNEKVVSFLLENKDIYDEISQQHLINKVLLKNVNKTSTNN